MAKVTITIEDDANDSELVQITTVSDPEFKEGDEMTSAHMMALHLSTVINNLSKEKETKDGD